MDVGCFAVVYGVFVVSLDHFCIHPRRLFDKQVLDRD